MPPRRGGRPAELPHLALTETMARSSFRSGGLSSFSQLPGS